MNIITACNSALDFAFAVTRYSTNIANTTTASSHQFNLIIRFGMAALIS